MNPSVAQIAITLAVGLLAFGAGLLWHGLLYLVVVLLESVKRKAP